MRSCRTWVWALPLLVVAGCQAPEQEPRSLWLGGDVLVGAERRALLHESLGMLAGSAGVVNLEGPLASGGVTRSAGGLLLRNDPSATALLRAAGVVGASLENNHRDDLGPQETVATRRLLRSEGFAVSGDPRGLRLSVSGAAVELVARDLSEGTPADLQTAVGAAAARADLVVASLHVTGPPSHLPSARVRAAVDGALAAGAQAVVLHGSHVLGPVERRGGSVIAWGLGNLAFDCDCTEHSEAMILELWPAAGGQVGAAVIPIEAGLKGRAARRAADPGGTLALLRALDSTDLRRDGARYLF